MKSAYPGKCFEKREQKGRVMSRVLPILFNTDMVRAILDGSKTVTRRVIPERILDKYYDYDEFCNCVITSDMHCTRSYEKDFFMSHARYHPEDIIYVRETWCSGYDGEAYFYFADKNTEREQKQLIDYDNRKWCPSIHMPKEAARIWLKVTDVRVERLQDIGLIDCRREGIDMDRSGIFIRFSVLWDSTVKKSDVDTCGWKANPWVWVIEFERCEKPEIPA